MTHRCTDLLDYNYKPHVKALHNAWHLTGHIISHLHYVAILHVCVCVRACVRERERQSE